MKEYITSSKTVEWETPQALFENLNREFDLGWDVCATHANTKLSAYWTKQEDGLVQDWTGKRCWMNPPYGDPENPCKKRCVKKRCPRRGYCISEYVPGIEDWVEKAATGGAAIVIALLPARTDTKWFHEYIYNRLWENTKVRFLKGRLKFGEAKNSAPFPSMVVVFEPIP